MVVILFRSRLTPQAGQDYQELDAELERLVRDQPGYVTHKAYGAADGERLTLVWFQDQETLRAWKMLPRHLEDGVKTMELIDMIRGGWNGPVASA